MPVTGGLWQLVPFIDGVPLDREKYLREGWRAELLSRFLIGLKQKSRELPYFSPEDRFSIVAYIRMLFSRIEQHAPALMPRVGRAIAFLEREFMGVHDSLRSAFATGITIR